MSENLDLVRSIYGAWERGDVSSMEWAHPEIEFVIADGPSPGKWTGLSGMTEGWRAFLGVWKEFHAEADEHRVIDDERVLVLDRFSGRGKISGLEVSTTRTQGALLFRLRNSLVTQLVLYLDRDRALAELGLKGYAVSAENVELVRAIYTAWNTGESVAHLVDPDFEYVNPPYAVEPGVRRGQTEFDKVRKQMLEVYPDYRFEADRFVDAGEDIVIIGVARGTSVSGVEAQWNQGYVYTIRGGKLIRFRWFNQPSEALKAVGLEE